MGRATLRRDYAMAKDHGPSIKDDKQYEGLRKKGMSKSRAEGGRRAQGRQGLQLGARRQRRSAERDRHLLEEVHRLLHAGLHPGVDVSVAVLLARVLHEN